MQFCCDKKMNKNEGGVYMIVNNITNGVYVGSTHNLYERFGHHERRARQLYFNYPLYQAIREYGSENFTFTVLSVENNENKRLKAEEYYINQFSLDPDIIVYNVVKHPGKPVHMTKELRSKLSAAHKKGCERKFNKETMIFENQ